MEQEPIYLNYGNDAQIELNAFLNAASNNVENYLSLLPWSNKRKNLFRKAYVDIMSHGVTGATNDTGIWNVQYRGNQIDLDSLSKKEREMYGEAAYYILQLMSGIPTKLSLELKEEEKKEEEKKELPVFDNKYFTELFQGYIGNEIFGGQNWDRSTQWNILDDIGDDKKRGVVNRTKKLADLLEGYIGTLEEGKYNFEGSPFKDLNDVKTRLLNAVNALRSVDPNDDAEALNRAGINPETYLSRDVDPEVAAAAILLRLQQTQTGEEKEEEKKEELEIPQFTLWQSKIGLKETTPEQLASKYKNDEGIIAALNEFSNSGISAIKNSDWSDIVGAYNFYNANGRLVDLSADELKLFSKKEGYQNLKVGDIKRLPGVEGFYFDTRYNRVLYPGDNGSSSQGGEDLLGKLGPEQKAKDYYNRTASGPAEFSSAEWAEIGSVIGDIVSIIDPEPFSAAALALGSAGARHYARALSPEEWSFGDILSQIGDYATGLIGAIPIVGDAVLTTKVMKTLKRIGRFGAWKDILSNYPEIKDIWTNKIFGDESMTAGDWKALAEFFRGIVGHGRLNKHNIAERKILLQRGVAQQVPKEEIKGIRKKISEWSKRTGFTRTKPAQAETTTDTLRVKVKGKDGVQDIEIKDKAAVEKKLRKAGNDLAQKDKEIRDLDEVQAYAKDNNVKLEDVSVVSEPKSNWSRVLHRGRRDVSESFGTKSSSTTRGLDTFEEWMKTRTTRDRMIYGSDRRIRKMDKVLQKEYGYGPKATQGTTTQTTSQLDNTQETTQSSEQKTNSDQWMNPKDKNFEKTRQMRKKAREYRNSINRALNPKKESKPIKVDSNGTAELNIVINGKNIKFTYAKNNKGEYELVIDNAGTVSTHTLDPKQGSFAVKKLVAKTIEDARSAGRSAARTSKTKNDLKMEDLIKSIRNLKKSGFLRQGGVVNKDMYTIVSEFLNKLK